MEADGDVQRSVQGLESGSVLVAENASVVVVVVGQDNVQAKAVEAGKGNGWLSVRTASVRSRSLEAETEGFVETEIQISMM